MKTQYYTAASLDGFIATEDDSLDWLFPLGDLNDTSYPAFIAGVANPPLRLVSARQVGSGFAELHYEVRGSDAVVTAYQR